MLYDRAIPGENSQILMKDRQTDQSTWQERIVCDPSILVGKPIIKGSRIAVESVIDLLSQGWTEDDILENYPGLTTDDIRASLAYARDLLSNERIYPLGA